MKRAIISVRVQRSRDRDGEESGKGEESGQVRQVQINGIGIKMDMRRGTLSASANNGGALDTVSTLNTTSGVTGNQKNWSLNAVGGWKSVTTDGTATSHTTNAQNETTAVGASGLTYDNNGNVTKNSNGYTLTYNAWNHLVTSSQGSGNTFTYDALGRLVTYQPTGSTLSYWYYGGDHLIQTGSATVYDQYMYGLNGPNEMFLRDRDHATGGNYGITGSGLEERVYAQADANGNETSLYRVSGTAGVIERFIYDAYGTPKTLTASWASYSDTSIYWRFEFQGEYWMYETNTYRMDARDFDYTIGAWDQRDPIGYGDGMNDYQGFGGNPVAKVDPLGRATADPEPPPAKKTPAIVQPLVKAETYLGSPAAGAVAEVGGHVGATIAEICLAIPRAVDTVAEGKKGPLSYNSTAPNKVPLLWVPLQQGLNRWWGHWWKEASGNGD